MAFGEIPKKDGGPAYFSSGKKGKASQLRNIALIALVVLIVLVAILAYNSMFAKPTPPSFNITNITLTNDTSNATTSCDDACLMTKAIATANYSFCLEIKNETMSQNCLRELSQVSLEACVRLKNYTIKKACVELHAISQKSTEVCNNLAVEDRKQCIEKIDPCFYKIDVDKLVCMARLNKDFSYCEKDEECLFQYADLENDANACKDIDSKVKRQVCLNLVEKKDRCVDLGLASQIDYCRQLYAIKANNPSLCDALPPDTSYSYECYTFFAINRKDMSYCKKLSLNDRWKCYQLYSLAAYDPQGCVAINKRASSARYKCFLDLATKYNNASVCEYIEVASQKVDCYYISMGFNNEIYPPENCEGIQVDIWRDTCYSTLAKRLKNITICDYVLSEGMKKQCISSIK